MITIKSIPLFLNPETSQIFYIIEDYFWPMYLSGKHKSSWIT